MLPPKKYRPPVNKSSKNIHLKKSKIDYLKPVKPVQTHNLHKLNISEDHKQIYESAKYTRPSSAVSLSQRSLASNKETRNNKQNMQLNFQNKYNGKMDKFAQRCGSVNRIRKCSINSTVNLRNPSIQLKKRYIENQSTRNNVQYHNQIPKLTSKNWGIFQMRENKFIAGFRTQKRRQMASLTKIMNFITILEIIKQRSINPKNLIIPVHSKSAKIIGTTAQLKNGDCLSLYDLFYGMMLPSGNDAAYQIALIGGSILKIYDNHPELNNLKTTDILAHVSKQKQVLLRYLKEMNNKSKEIGAKKSKWSNPHGLSNCQNYTTVQDMFCLCSYAMKNMTFREVVSAKEYQCNISYQEELQQNIVVSSRVAKWQNTNKMLWKEWSGIKTGITPNAGPCLAASVIKTVQDKQKQYLVVLGSCISKEQRWKEVEALVDWAVKQQDFC